MGLPPRNLVLTSLLVSFATTFHFGYQLLLPNPAESAFHTFANNSLYGMGKSPSWDQVEVGSKKFTRSDFFS